MHAPTRNVTRSQPVLMKYLVTPWGRRHPRFVARIHFAAGIVVLGVAVLLLSLGYSLRVSLLYWLVAIPLAGAALHFWIAYHLRRSI